MTRLASVTFNGKKEQVGGAQIPALAFKKWCDILGIDCDYIDYNNLWDKQELNNYTGVFFCTPINYSILNECKLNVPFVSMIHAEFDKKLIIDEANDQAEAIAVIGFNYWDCFKPKQLYWHPCTLPEYLLTGDEVFEKNKSGLIYAARLSKWKNALLLSALTKYQPFMDIVEHVTVYGEANREWYENAIEILDPNWTRIKGIYSINDFEESKNRFEKFNLFWDVCGNKNYKIKIPRINLAAYEAMKFGVIPIVDQTNTPPSTDYFTIDLNKLGQDINRINIKRALLVEGARYKFYGYNQVKQQVSQIIEVLT
jgi:hypothetical protein